MTLHLIKLCVGVETIRDLEDWIVEKRRMTRSAPDEHVHTTRMAPKRHGSLVDGGSLYWVIKGQLACRQSLLDIRPFTDKDGIGRCHIVLEPAVVPVRARPCRPFQGWRYLEPGDAPPDLGAAADDIAGMPETLRRELVTLGLL